MKTFGAIIAALFVGYLLGGLIPTSKLQASRDELSELRRSVNEMNRKRMKPLSGVNQFLDIRDDNKTGAGIKSSRPDAADTETDRTADVTESIVTTNAVTVTPTNRTANTLSNRIDMAANAWGLRAELAKNAFVENTGLDEPTTARFHVLIEAMNIRLGESISTWADKVREQEVRDEEAAIRMMNDLSKILVLTYDEMDRNLPKEWRKTAGKKFNLTSFIDPDVARPLADLEKERDGE